MKSEAEVRKTSLRNMGNDKLDFQEFSAPGKMRGNANRAATCPLNFLHSMNNEAGLVFVQCSYIYKY